MFDVFYYRLPDGTKPVEAFLKSMDIPMRAKALSGIAILKEHGNMLREPYSKHIDSGIFELRIKLAKDISRIFYFFQSGRSIILTNGYMKKSQKLDRREFEKAIAYKKDYERSKENG